MLRENLKRALNPVPKVNVDTQNRKIYFFIFIAENVIIFTAFIHRSHTEFRNKKQYIKSVIKYSK